MNRQFPDPIPTVVMGNIIYLANVSMADFRAGPGDLLDVSTAVRAVDVLARFGELMLRSGNTASRTREWIDVIARKMGVDEVSMNLSFDSITVHGRRAGEWATAMREIGPPGIDVWRTTELEQLARSVGHGLAPREIALRLAEIELATPQYPNWKLALAVGAASGSFAFLNGAAAPEIIAAAIGGGVGQWSRLWMSSRQMNQYGVAAWCAIVASGVYVLAAEIARHFGLGFAHYPAGFIASVLFLIPGFPLIAALFDLLRHRTAVAVGRLAYGTMLLLAVAFGLGIVIAVAGVDLSYQSPLELTYPLKVLLRAAASAVAGCAFAMLFNSSPRIVFAVGLLALGANGMRLVLNDLGMMLAPAAFFAAVVIGVVAAVVNRSFDVPRMAMIVAPIVIMVPGISAYQTIVLFNHGQMVDALQAFATCAFVIGALAMGLATALFFDPR